MLTLNNSVRLISFQFSFSNRKLVPAIFQKIKKGTETVNMRKGRKGRKVSGKMLLPPTMNCFLGKIFNDLEDSYALVNVFCQNRIDPKDPEAVNIYYAVRFTFARNEFAEPSSDFIKMRRSFYQEFKIFVIHAMWRARAYLNPFFQNEKNLDGQFVLSINLEARTPLTYPDGNRVAVWKKDPKGKKIGDGPIPIKPDYFLRTKNNKLALLKVI